MALTLFVRDEKGNEIRLPKEHEVAGWLATHREGRGKSLQEVADACGVTRQAVYGWENDKTQPDLDHLLKLVQFFYETPEDKALEDRLDEATALLNPPEKAAKTPAR